MRHLLGLAFPLLTLVYVATAPHPPASALSGLLLVVAVVFLDGRAASAKAQAPPARGWPFTALVIALALIQLATMALFLRAAARGGWRLDLLLVGWFVGNNSGWCSLVVAHEL